MGSDDTTRRSKRIVTTLLTAAAAAALSGCSSTTTARCLGPDGRVVPDSVCGPVGGGSYGGGGSVRPAAAHWVYGGSGGTAVGSRVTGYSTTAPESGDISTASGTTLRGGFGGEGHGGEGGGGEGHGGGGE